MKEERAVVICDTFTLIPVMSRTRILGKAHPMRGYHAQTDAAIDEEEPGDYCDQSLHNFLANDRVVARRSEARI